MSRISTIKKRKSSERVWFSALPSLPTCLRKLWGPMGREGVHYELRYKGSAKMKFLLLNNRH